MHYLAESAPAINEGSYAALTAERAPDAVRVGLEAGSTSAWLWRGLTARGVPAVCMETRHAHRALSARTHKTDRNDARGLAELLRMGWFREARVRGEAAQLVRSLLTSRRRLVLVRRDLENAMRGIAKAFGLLSGASTAGRGFVPAMRRAAAEDPSIATALTPLIVARDAVVEQAKVLDGRIVVAARRDATIRRLMTVPGVGALTATAYVTAVDDPGRFTSSASVGPFLGLAPRVHQSGEIDRTGRITKAGDTLARTYLYEAAGVLLTRVQRSCALRSWGLRLAKRAGWKRAKIAVARKLAVLLHAIWTDGTEFDWGGSAAAA